ncbi:acyl carrier protein [Cohnella soli]|uniref:Acyl carrier protein n=1 Tax=Cohnella soli TaxID=425005 RepID=A0ABW0I1U8_9BACL
MNTDMNRLTARLIELASQLVDETLNEDCLDASFADIGIDSLMALELAVYLEREFGIRLTEEELGEITKLRDIIDIVERKRG